MDKNSIMNMLINTLEIKSEKAFSCIGHVGNIIIEIGIEIFNIIAILEKVRETEKER